MASPIMKETVGVESVIPHDSVRLIRGLRRRPTQWAPGWITYWSTNQLPRHRFPDICRAYAAIFAESPWNETWMERDVIRKLLRELTVPAQDLIFLTLLDGNDHYSVGGFNWGAVVEKVEIPGRMLSSRSFTGSDIDAVATAIGQIKEDTFIFADEIGIVKDLRLGVLPLAELCYPHAFLAAVLGLGVMCWSETGPDSKFPPIIEAYGWKKICVVGGKVVLYYQDIEGIIGNRDAERQIIEGFGVVINSPF